MSEPSENGVGVTLLDEAHYVVAVFEVLDVVEVHDGGEVFSFGKSGLFCLFFVDLKLLKVLFAW